MIISNSHRFIFVHVNKAAGTSVTEALAGHAAWNDVVIGGVPDANQDYFENRFGLTKHATAVQIRKVVGEDLWNSYFTFAFVRHPYTRTASLYTYLVELARRNRKRTGLRARLTGRQRRAPFWDWPATRALLETSNFSEFIRHPLIHESAGLTPQTHWLFDRNDRLLVDFVGRVESMDRHFGEICQRVGLGAPALGHRNRSPKENRWRSLYRRKSDYQLVYEALKPDFEAFGFSREYRG